MTVFGAMKGAFEAVGGAVVATVTAPVRVVGSAIQGDWDAAYEALKDIPLVSDAIDVGEGIAEGDFAKIGMGLAGGMLTVATGGAGGVATAGAKGVAKNVAKQAAKNSVKKGGARALKKVMKKEGKNLYKKGVKIMKKEGKAQAKHEMKAEGKIITACLLLEQPKVLSTILTVFYKSGKIAGPLEVKGTKAAGAGVLGAVAWCVEKNPGMLISASAAEVFGELALRLYQEKKTKKKKRKCIYDHRATERIAKSLLIGLKALARQKVEAGFAAYVKMLLAAASGFKAEIAAVVTEVKKQSGWKRVVKVEGRAGDFLDYVKFTYSDGTTSSIGSSIGGVPMGELKLRKDEYIVKVLAKSAKYFQGCGVTFLTSQGRNYAMRGSAYNNDRTQEHLFEVAPGVQIIGLTDKVRGVTTGGL